MHAFQDEKSVSLAHHLQSSIHSPHRFTKLWSLPRPFWAQCSYVNNIDTIQRFPKLVLPAMLLCLFWTGKATDKKCEAFGANSLIKSWCISVTLRRYRSVWAWNSFSTKFIIWTCDIFFPPPFPNINWQPLRTVIQLPRATWFPSTVAIFLRPAGWQIKRQEVPLSLNQLKCVRKYIWHDLQKCQVWRWQDSQSFPDSFSTPKFQSVR